MTARALPLLPSAGATAGRRPKGRTALELPRCPTPPRQLLPACRCCRQPRPHHRTPVPAPALPSAPALPKPAGQAGALCRVGVSSGLCQAPQAETKALQEMPPDPGGIGGRCPAPQPRQSPSTTICTPVYLPALPTPTGRLDTQRCHPLSISRLTPCLVSPHLTQWAMRSPALRGEDAPAAAGLAERLPVVPAPPHAGPPLHEGKKVMCHRAFIIALVQPQHIFPSCQRTVRTRCSHRAFTIHIVV